MRKATDLVTFRIFAIHDLRFLRWHYPNQVQRSKVLLSSQPVSQAPCFYFFVIIDQIV